MTTCDSSAIIQIRLSKEKLCFVCLSLLFDSNSFFRRKPWDSVNFLIGIMSISDLLAMPLLNTYIVPKSSPTESRHPETSHYFRFRSCCKQWTRGLFGRSKYLIYMPKMNTVNLSRVCFYIRYKQSRVSFYIRHIVC
jgi:hypothetical protein